MSKCYNNVSLFVFSSAFILFHLMILSHFRVYRSPPLFSTSIHHYFCPLFHSSLPFPSLPILSLSVSSHTTPLLPILSLSFPSLSIISLPSFPSLPFPSLLFLSFPFYSLPFSSHTLTFAREPINSYMYIPDAF